MQYYLNVLREYATFEGRARRTEFWMFALINLGIVIALEIVDAVLAQALGFTFLTFLYSLAVLVPSLAVGVRRLHDTDRSGWWLLIGLVPLVGAIVLIVFYATEGQRGPNQYGPDPKLAEQQHPQVAY